MVGFGVWVISGLVGGGEARARERESARLRGAAARRRRRRFSIDRKGPGSLAARENPGDQLLRCACLTVVLPPPRRWACCCCSSLSAELLKKTMLGAIRRRPPPRLAASPPRAAFNSLMERLAPGRRCESARLRAWSPARRQQQQERARAALVFGFAPRLTPKRCQRPKLQALLLMHDLHSAIQLRAGCQARVRGRLRGVFAPAHHIPPPKHRAGNSRSQTSFVLAALLVPWPAASRAGSTSASRASSAAAWGRRAISLLLPLLAKK